MVFLFVIIKNGLTITIFFLGGSKLTKEVEAPVAAAAATEAKPAEVAAEGAPKEEAPVAPKTAKRNSVFGTFFEKIRSPTHEKKESELAPAVPAKDETEAAAPAPAAEPAAPAVAPVVDGPSEAAAAPVVPEEPKAEEAKATETTTPSKEKKGFSFNKVFGSVSSKVKSPVSEKPPTLQKTEEAPKVEEAPKTEEAAPVVGEPAAEAPKAETPVAAEAPKTEEATAPVTEAAEPKSEKRKSSFFGGLTGTSKAKAEASPGEKHPSKLSGLFRNPSKAVKSKKESQVNSEAAAEAPKEETPAATEAPSTEVTSETKPEEPATIGDVVPEAVSVGEAKPVSAAA